MAGPWRWARSWGKEPMGHRVGDGTSLRPGTKGRTMGPGQGAKGIIMKPDHVVDRDKGRTMVPVQRA